MSKNRVYSYLLVPATVIGAWLINYNFPFATLWLLFLIPGLLIVSMYPRWLTVWILVITSLIVIVYTEGLIYHKGHIEFVGSQELLVAGLVGLVLFVFISYLTITNIRLHRELGKLSITDTLTRTYNRRYLEMFLEEDLPLFKKGNGSLTIILFDIDHFKKINDTFGHHKGDNILKIVAMVSKRIIRGNGTIIRMGGEEFLIILPNVKIDKAQRISNRISKEVGKETYLREGNFTTLSFGIARYNTKQGFDELLNKADEALYQAKENGRNQVVVADN